MGGLPPRLWIVARLLVLAALAAPASSAAAAGQLHPSFSGDGRVLVNSGGQDFVDDLAVGSDGRILLAGASYVGGGATVADLARVGLNGELDPTLAGSGMLATTFGRPSSYLQSVVPLPDGRFVIVTTSGSGPRDILVDRLNSDGTVDPTFTPTTIDFGGDDYPTSATSGPDGKIYIVGSSSAAGNYDAVVARVKANGGLDASFAGTGKRVIALTSQTERMTDVVVQPDGRSVLAMESNAVSSMIFIGLGNDGNPDPGFGTSGFAIVSFPLPAEPNAMALQPDGKIVVSGDVKSGADYDVAVARIDSSGALDLTFGTNGTETFPDAAVADAASAVALQPDGKIVIGGSTGSMTALNQFVMRLGTSGGLDTAFGTGGRTIVDYGGFDNLKELRVAPDGAIVGAGSGGNINDMTVFRLLGDPAPPPPAGKCAGKTVTITGTERRDVIKGTKKRDVIGALGGNDKVSGLGGNDLICGGAGKDSLYGGPGRDTLIGQAGADRLFGGPARDALKGGP